MSTDRTANPKGHKLTESKGLDFREVSEFLNVPIIALI